MQAAMDCLPGSDDVFGPQVLGCRDFDFTLLFEQTILQVGSCAALLLSVIPRVLYLRTQPVKATGNTLTYFKLGAVTALACTQVAMLVVWSVNPVFRNRASIPATVVSLLASVALCFLSFVEDSRSVRPSSLINAYLLASIVLDLPQARTLWLRPIPTSLPGIFTTGVLAKAVSACLEACSKRQYLFAQYRSDAPEMLVSLYDRTMLWWLNPIFQLGFRNQIASADMLPLD